MGADANIFQQYLRPVKSVQEYSSERDDATAKRQAIEQNALSLDATRQSTQRANAFRDLAMTLPSDPSERVKALRSASTPEAWQAADALEKSQGEIGKTVAETGKYNAEAGSKTLEAKIKAHDFSLQKLQTVNDPASAHLWAVDELKSGNVTPDQFMQGISKIPSDPAQFEAWKQKAMQGGVSVLDNMKIQHEDARSAATNATSRANNSASVGATMRGQNMTDSRMQKAPAGYAWGAAGADGNPTLIAVKGGPADLKLAGALNQDTQALSGSTSSMDRLATAANEVLNHPGLNGVYGLRGAIPNVPGTDAADAAALLNTLKSQVGFGVLQDMRNNSKTGGALGAVSDSENKMLQSNLAALEKAQSVEQARKSLAKIVQYSQDAKDRLRNAYNTKHGEQTGQQPAAQPATTKAGATVSAW